MNFLRSVDECLEQEEELRAADEQRKGKRQQEAPLLGGKTCDVRLYRKQDGGPIRFAKEMVGQRGRGGWDLDDEEDEEDHEEDEKEEGDANALFRRHVEETLCSDASVLQRIRCSVLGDEDLGGKAFSLDIRFRSAVTSRSAGLLRCDPRCYGAPFFHWLALRWDGVKEPVEAQLRLAFSRVVSAKGQVGGGGAEEEEADEEAPPPGHDVFLLVRSMAEDKKAGRAALHDDSTVASLSPLEKPLYVVRLASVVGPAAVFRNPSKCDESARDDGKFISVCLVNTWATNMLRKYKK